MAERANGIATPTPDLEAMLTAMRPRLHRFAARMTGSVIEGEDVVQETMLKALEARPARPIANPEAWVFRIARNTALDLLRRRGRERPFDEDESEEIADPVMDTDRGYVAAAGLRMFMQLPPAQRACAILMDVIGYSLDEVGAILEMTVPAVKAALHRGRGRLKVATQRPDGSLPIVLPDAERRQLETYIRHFNARDFDAIRALLADDVRVDVHSSQIHGKVASSRYFTRYDALSDWHLEPGIVDGQPVALVRGANGEIGYFMAVDWRDDLIAVIRDYRGLAYLLEDAAPRVL